MRILFVFLCAVRLGFAQEVSFTASSNATEIPAGNTFTISFTLENAEGEGFHAPDFKPFRLVAGPSQSHRSVFINGKATTSTSFSYTLLANLPGVFRIAPARINVGSKELYTEEVQIKVLEASDPLTQAKTGEDARIFLRAEVDTPAVYIGQQVLIRYKIYTQDNIENYNILSESSYDGCFTQMLDAYREPVLKEMVNGQPYTTKVLRKVAVFPQQSGLIEIDPLVVRVGIANEQRRRSFFSSFSLKTKNLSSNTVTLEVTSAYDQAPQDFSGAVGQFRPRYRISSLEASTDEALTLQLQISGNGDVKTIRAPALKLPQSFELYEPKTKDEKMINATDSVRGVKTFEYLMLAGKPGSYQLTPQFTYFDPRQNRYIDVRDTFKVQITAGSGTIVSPGDHQLAGHQQGLQHLGSTNRLRTIRRPMIYQPWYWATASLPVLGFLFLLYRSRNQVQIEAAEDHHGEAKSRLELARSFIEAKDHKAFYEEIALSIKRYLARRLKIQFSDMDKAQILGALEHNGWEQEHIARIRSLLDQCDFALYAGIQKEENMEAVYHQALEVITILSADHHAL